MINNNSELDSEDFIDLCKKITATIAYLVEICDDGIKNMHLVRQVDDGVEIMKMILDGK